MAKWYGPALFGGENVLKNADCTLFEKDTYTRHALPGVYWNDSRGRTVTTNGIQVSDSVIMYVYDDAYVPKNGDIIVKGAADFTFTTTSEQTISASMKLFRAAYPQFAVIKQVNDCRYGGLPHIEVIAR